MLSIFKKREQRERRSETEKSKNHPATVRARAVSR